MKRLWLVPLLLLVIAQPAGAHGLSVHRAKQAIGHYADGTARVGECRKVSRLQVRCTVTEYGVSFGGTHDWDLTYSATAKAIHSHHKKYVHVTAGFTDSLTELL